MEIGLKTSKFKHFNDILWRENDVKNASHLPRESGKFWENSWEKMNGKLGKYG